LVAVNGGVTHTRDRRKARKYATESGARISIGGARKYDGGWWGAKVKEIGHLGGYCPRCGRENAIVNQCRCDPNNLPTKIGKEGGA